MINILTIATELKTYLLQDTNVYTNNDRHFFKIKIRNYFGIDVYIIPKDYSLGVQYFAEGFEKYIKHKLEDSGSTNDYLQYLASINLENLKINFSIEELSDDIDYINAIYSNESIDYGVRTRLSSLIDGGIRKVKKTKTPIITFYSYKGGMGRTTTMVSYAIDLALRDKKVFIIDCDLEAPGYINFFNLSKNEDLKAGKINGFVEYLADMEFYKTNTFGDNRRFPLENYYLNIVSWNSDKNIKLQNIYLMPAGNLNESDEESVHKNRKHYLEALSRINISSPASINRHFEELIKQIDDEIGPDVILLDSRTGFNDIIGTSISYLSDMVVAFFGNNAQSKPGLYNILEDFLNSKKRFKLLFVNSILKVDNEENKQENYNKYSSFKNNIESYLLKNDNGVDTPQYSTLHRFEFFENIGTEQNDDERCIQLIQNKENPDYVEIFDAINENFPLQLRYESNYISDSSFETIISNTDDTQKEVIDDKVSQLRAKLRQMKTLELRNAFLENLRRTLDKVNAFAETTYMNSDLFYYRDCMNDWFYDYKFLIRGYKGTGKTYLYRALADKNENKVIANNIKKRAKNHGNSIVSDSKYNSLMFIDIISFDNGDKSFDFRGLQLNASPIKEDIEYFFTRFWQIYTWNSILLDKEFEDIKNNSKLRDCILPIKGSQSIKLYMDLIEKGIDVFIEIENDMNSINNYLKERETTLFIMYDQLDSKIKPQNWGKVVSPLINYWRDNYNTFSNILPKVFVRTDLMQRISGTNTARLNDNIINIEWKIEEIIGYFIKLAINSSEDSAELFFEILNRIKDGKYINTIKKYRDNERTKFDDSVNQNQVWPLNEPELRPFVYSFFGNYVRVNKSSFNLGRPDEYFKRNYANADGNSISLRPFINTFSSNTIERAKKVPPIKGLVTAIIPSEVYASKEVRDFAVNRYFTDLSQNEFSTDLIIFKNYLISSEGKKFRFKALRLEQLDKLLHNVVKKNIDNFESVQDEADLKSLLEANGIIAEDVRPSIGKIYRFAPLYYYNWQLVNTKFDDERKEDSLYSPYKSKKRQKIIDGQSYDGIITCRSNEMKVEIKDVFPSLLPIEGNCPYAENDCICCTISSRLQDNKQYYYVKADTIELK